MAKRMAKTVSKADLVNAVAEDTALRKKDVKDVLDSVLDNISTQLGKGNKATDGLGTFEVRSRKARTGVRPGTTEDQDPGQQVPGVQTG